MNYQATEALNAAKARMLKLLSESGAVLFSGTDTLVRGPLYVMGFNPGGSPDQFEGDGPKTCNTIGHSLSSCQTKWNSWTCDNYGASGTSSLLQTRIKTVFELLEADPRATFSTNALFVRSETVDKLTLPWQLWWERCWPVHQLFLRIVRPRVIVCLGNGSNESAWAFMQITKARLPGERTYERNWIDDENSDASRHGKWQPSISLNLGDDTSHECAILGLPHPSQRVSRSWPLSDKAKAKIALAKAAAVD